VCCPVLSSRISAHVLPGLFDYIVCEPLTVFPVPVISLQYAGNLYKGICLNIPVMFFICFDLPADTLCGTVHTVSR